MFIYKEVVTMRELTVLSCVLGIAGSVITHWFIFTLGKPVDHREQN